MRIMLLICLLVLVAGGAVGASASDPPPVIGPPTLPAEVTCSTDVAAMRQQAAQRGIELPADTPEGAMICFYPEHAR